MRTVIPYVASSEKRMQIVKTLLERPKMQWSCSTVEEMTHISHATVFRTLRTLRDLGITKSLKVNKRDIVYELVRHSPVINDFKRIFFGEEKNAKNIAHKFVNEIKVKIKPNMLLSAVLYGSSVKGDMKPESDIDVLIVLKEQVLKEHRKIIEAKIFDIAAKWSAKMNKTVSPVIISENELQKGKKSAFLASVKSNHEVLDGKKPF